jgi:hypothetical protein
MAENDIRVNSGTHEIRAYPVETSQDFSFGEPVVVDTTSGEVEECGSDPATVTGISATHTFNYVADPSGGTAVANNTLIGVYLPTDNTLFVVTVGGTAAAGNRFATDGAGTAATPTAATAVSEEACFIRASGNWFIDTAAANKHVLIEALYNSEGQNVKDPNATSTTAATMTFSFI